MACGSCGGRKTSRVRGHRAGVTASAAPTYEVTLADGSTHAVSTLVDARRLARSSHPRGTIKVK